MRCITLWYRGSVVPQNGGWNRKTNWVCISHFGPAEKKYSQLDKEGLAVIFGIKRFHNYLYGRNFTIVTDHKPLISLFSETKPVPQMVSPRVQRWSVWLRAYEYHIVYQPGRQRINADALSRLPLPETVPAEEGGSGADAGWNE